MLCYQSLTFAVQSGARRNEQLHKTTHGRQSVANKRLTAIETAVKTEAELNQKNRARAVRAARRAEQREEDRLESERKRDKRLEELVEDNMTTMGESNELLARGQTSGQAD